MRLWFAFIFMAAACGGGGGVVNDCVPGASLPCECGSTVTGVQICDDHGLLGACSCAPHGSPNGPTTPPPTTPPGTPPPTTTPPTSDPGGPMVVSFSANSSSLTEGQSVIFDAIVTTPAGNDGIAGGTLTSPDDAHTYGPFDAGTQKGAFSLALSWAQIDQTLSIDFTDGEARIFKAVFFDTSGRRVTATVSVMLACSGQPACGGKCVKASEEIPQECGVQTFSAKQAVSCNTVCASAGLTCIPYCHFALAYMDPSYNPLLAGRGDYGGSSGGTADFLANCSDVPPATGIDSYSNMTYPFTGIECCCH